MRHKGGLAALLTAVALIAGDVHANVVTSNFTFSGSSSGGTGSATMSIDIDDTTNTLTATVLNTSPLTLDSPLSGDNTPGIDGFGFNLDPDRNVLSWTLTAYSAAGLDASGNNLGSPEEIGSSTTTISDPWILTTGDANIQGVRLDYLPNNDSGVQKALYNPEATSGTGSQPYYTEAILTVVFDGLPVLADEVCSGSGPDAQLCTAYVRMQNVGLLGEGSLKLFDSNGGGPGNGGNGGGPGNGGVPEPSILSLFGVAMLGGFLTWRRRRAVA